MAGSKPNRRGRKYISEIKEASRCWIMVTPKKKMSVLRRQDSRNIGLLDHDEARKDCLASGFFDQRRLERIVEDLA